jgi:mannosylglycerate hydrolase
MARRTVAVVPHTHWDREWYLSFQAFRLKLVDTLDRFLPHLEHDPSYTRFLLDGQMAAVDDYLAVRPEAAATIRQLATAGRLAMGPWYTLMDEFLVSGETIVRNLQLGLARAAGFGGAMNVGYLPDMFGHIAQMPQLLRLAGMEHAVVWRGVPSSVDRSAFWWRAPDGSTVRAEYLVSGYGNGEGITDDAKSLVGRIAQFEDEFAGFLGPDGTWPILFMNGTDHQAPQPWLGRVVAEANAMQDDYEIAITSLPEFLGRAPTDGLPAHAGELRSGARANLLMGVASNRVDVKQAAARAERALERRAEPLWALYGDPDEWPRALLDQAWLEVVRNAAHDSVCACSIDAVCDAVLHRYREAADIGEGLADRALDRLAASMADTGWVVANTSQRTRSGMVELEVPGEGPIEGAQVLLERGALVADNVLSLDEARPLLGNIRSQQLGNRTFINAIDVEETGDGIELTLSVDRRLVTNLLVGQVMVDVLSRLADWPGGTGTVHLVIRRQPYRRVLVRVPDVPGLGWRLVGDVVAPAHPVSATAGDLGLTNGLVTVEVDPADGTFSVDGLAGFDRLVDGGDAGDTYNYSPPDDDVLVDAPTAVAVRRLEAGPVRGRIEVVRSYPWADQVVTTVEVRAGEPLVRVTTTIDNQRRDHRLRAHFPLPQPTTTSRAECAFAVVERGLEAEGGPHERGLPTFPCRRFVQAGGLTLVHDGLLEYEVVDRGRGLALTLLRATGMLSRVDMAYRPLPAGPPIAMEGSQVLGRHTLRYAVCVDAAADPYALVDDAFLPLDVAVAPGGGWRPAAGQALTVSGGEVSALRRVAGGTEVRLFNPTPAEAEVTVDRQGWVVDLRGGPVEPFDGRLGLRPWGIVTLLLPDPAG